MHAYKKPHPVIQDLYDTAFRQKEDWILCWVSIQNDAKTCVLLYNILLHNVQTKTKQFLTDSWLSFHSRQCQNMLFTIQCFVQKIFRLQKKKKVLCTALQSIVVSVNEGLFHLFWDILRSYIIEMYHNLNACLPPLPPIIPLPLSTMMRNIANFLNRSTSRQWWKQPPRAFYPFLLLSYPLSPSSKEFTHL